MHTKIDLIKAEADVKRPFVGALSDEQIDEPMHKTPWEDERARHGNDANVIMLFGKIEIKCFIAEEANRIFVQRIQAEVLVQIEEDHVNLLQIRNNAA